MLICFALFSLQSVSFLQLTLMKRYTFGYNRILLKHQFEAKLNCSKNVWSLLLSTGEYSCLRTVLILRREYSFYLIQLYIPSFMLVVVSWVNFWIDKDAVPARVSLGVTTLLTMTTQASGVNAKLPPVSYTKAVDVWIGVCLAFIFGALLEFALVNYAGRVEFLEKERKKQTVTLASTSIPPAVPTHAPITTTSAVNIQHRHQIGASLDDTCAQCDEERNIGMMVYVISQSATLLVDINF